MVSSIFKGSEGIGVKTRVLVTGSTGFIGRCLLKRLLREEVEVATLSRGKSSSFIKQENAINIQADLLDYPKLSRKVRDFAPEVIFHLAGVRPMERSWAAVQQAYQINLLGTMNLLRSLQEGPCKSIIIMGSTAEYGRGQVPYREKQALRPGSAYGAAKAATTILGLLAWQYFELPVTVLRPTLVYGPGQGEQFFLSQLLRNLLLDKPFAMTAGEQYRDFIYVTDVVEALWQASCNPTAVGGIYNIGSGISLPLREVAELAAAMLGRKHLLQLGAKPYSLDEQFAYCVDITLVSQILKWQPEVSLEQGLTATIGWYQQLFNYHSLS